MALINIYIYINIFIYILMWRQNLKGHIRKRNFINATITFGLTSATIFAQMPIPLDRDWQCARCDRNYSWTDLTWMEQHVWFQFQRHGPWPGSWIASGPWHRLDVKVCADCAEFVHRTMWRTTDGLVRGCSCYFIDFESRGAHFYNTITGG